MKSKLLLLAVTGIAVAFLGCGSGSKDAEQVAGDAAKATEQAADKAEDAMEHAADKVDDAMPDDMAVNAVSMEVGCGMCTYHMDGVDVCTPAVKMGDKSMLLTGVPVDAHALGLCAAPKEATITGKVEDGKLVASAVDFK